MREDARGVGARMRCGLWTDGMRVYCPRHSITMTIYIFAIALLAILVIAAGGRYNNLVALRNRFKNAFAQIEVQLKRRHDLIPNLVETAKGYMQHERGTMEAVIAARNEAVTATTKAARDPAGSGNMAELAGAEGSLTGALGRLFALAESYPDLKANQTMTSLMEELTTTENKVSFARQSYNDSVMAYNTAREQFPDVLYATVLGFGQAELFEISDSGEREVPKVSF